MAKRRRKRRSQPKSRRTRTRKTSRRTSRRTKRKSGLRGLGKQLQRRLRSRRTRYERDSSYRERFIAAYPAPWRCQYCGAAIPNASSLEVDHLVSVDAAQKSPLARLLLHAIGAKSVNDLENLVPACHDCNSRKGAKTGLWTLRGLLGGHRWRRALPSPARGKKTRGKRGRRK